MLTYTQTMKQIAIEDKSDVRVKATCCVNVHIMIKCRTMTQFFQNLFHLFFNYAWRLR